VSLGIDSFHCIMSDAGEYDESEYYDINTDPLLDLLYLQDTLGVAAAPSSNQAYSNLGDVAGSSQHFQTSASLEVAPPFLGYSSYPAYPFQANPSLGS
jgi:hypothetical protein